MITLAEKKIKIKCPKLDGYFVRWYFNGWHSWFFYAGGEDFTTKGEWHNTESQSKVKMGCSGLTYDQVRAIRTALFALRVEVLMQDGWKAAIIDNTTLKIYDSFSNGYNCEFTITIYAKVADYTPVTPPQADYDPIVSYDPLPDITVFVDDVVNLPNTVQVTFKSGKVETMIVKWEVSSVNTSVAGTQKIYGDIGNGAAAVLQNVIVNELSDLDILRQIRAANPMSQLPTLWDDAQDPYTEWEWVTWNENKTKVTAIDISSTNTVDLSLVYKLTGLKTLFCNNNKLTSLDVHGLDLNTLNCSYNDLTDLSTLTAKGNITQFACMMNYLPVDETDRIQGLGFQTNEVLPQKDDLDILRQIRDANPASQLPSWWLDSEDPYTEWEGVTWNNGRVVQLDIDYADIALIPYVNKLTALQFLDCSYNQLTSLNVAGLTSLQALNCSYSQLTALNIAGLTSLRYLYCYYNQLTALNVTGLIALQYLLCTSNQLTSLDVTGLNSLQTLYCQSNQLTSLDVTGLTNLQELYCNSNQLTALNVTGLTALQYLICSSNQLTTIPTLTARGLITTADFYYNKFNTTEVNRLLSIGFTAREIGTQNP